MKIVCINPPKIVKRILKLFAKNRKKPVKNDGQSDDK